MIKIENNCSSCADTALSVRYKYLNLKPILIISSSPLYCTDYTAGRNTSVAGSGGKRQRSLQPAGVDTPLKHHLPTLASAAAATVAAISPPPRIMTPRTTLSGPPQTQI